MLKFPLKKTRILLAMLKEYLSTLSEVSKKINFNIIEKLSKLILNIIYQTKIFLFVEMAALLLFQIILFVTI